MKRKIITINEEKCNGCGACAAACHEGAIGMVNGKAKLLRDDYCDALGDCLPSCPTGAITFTEREAAEYDKEAVALSKMQKTMQQAKAAGFPNGVPFTCPGSRSRMIERTAETAAAPVPAAQTSASSDTVSELTSWPVQIKLAPVNASYFNHARLLIAADCTAYSRADFHSRFMKGRVTLIGCPKLDAVDYSEKLSAILKNNEIRDVTVVRMEVPCCGGIEQAVKTALQQSGKMIPWQVVTLSTEGNILE